MAKKLKISESINNVFGKAVGLQKDPVRVEAKESVKKVSLPKSGSEAEKEGRVTRKQVVFTPSLWKQVEGYLIELQGVRKKRISFNQLINELLEEAIKKGV